MTENIYDKQSYVCLAGHTWDALRGYLQMIAEGPEDVKEIWVLDRRVRKFIRKRREEEFLIKIDEKSTGAS